MKSLPPPVPKRQWSLNSRATRGLLFQLIALVLIALGIWFLAHNTQRNMAARGIQSGFDFLGASAGFDIGETVIAYDPSESYGKAIWVGVLNTLKVAVAGIILSTLLGVMLGVGRLLLANGARSELSRSDIQQALAQQERRLRLVLDSMGGGHWEWDVVQRQFRCHGSFYETFGITAADLEAPDLWQRWYARRHPQDAERNAARLARAMDGLEDSYEAEFRVMDTEGRWHWLMSRGTVATRDAQNRPTSLIGMDVDITAHRAAEDALRSSEAKYTTFYQTLPDPAGISRISDGRYIDVNPAFCEVLGRPREEVIGRTSTELNIWASEQERKRLVETFRRDGKVDRLPLVAQREGGRIPGLMSARSVLVDGENCFVFVFHDMTEAHRASDELRALNGLLQQAGRLARLGAWEDERGKGLVYWSDVCFDIHGLPPGSPLPHDYIDRHVAPAYRETLRANFRLSILERREWSMEIEVLHTDGRLVLLDPVTGDRINLESFGPTNAAVFARLRQATPIPTSHGGTP